MAMNVSRFGALRNLGHVAADAITERVDGMCADLLHLLMAFHAAFVAFAVCLRSCWAHSKFMRIMTGGAGYASLEVAGLFPVYVLLMMTLRELIGVNMLDITGFKRCRLVEGTE